MTDSEGNILYPGDLLKSKESKKPLLQYNGDSEFEWLRGYGDEEKSLLSQEAMNDSLWVKCENQICPDCDGLYERKSK